MANVGEPHRTADDVTELVARARAGDRRAASELFSRYRPRIFALALHITGSASDADDITQDAFVRAYRHLVRFEGRSHFFTWLYRIAIHRAWNARRDAVRRRGVSLEDDRVLAAVAVDADENHPEEAALLRERYAELLTAFDKLSPALRTTVTLVALQGLSHKEAAVVLETTEGTVAWRIHEARRQLRGRLEGKSARRALAPKASTTNPDSLVARRARQDHDDPLTALLRLRESKPSPA